MNDYKNFKLGELFEFKAIKQAKSQKAIPTDNTDGGVPYIIQSTRNNMFSRNVNKQWLIDHNEAPVPGNRIVLGVTLPAVSYQPNEFGASQVITATSEHLNRYNGNYIATVISKKMYQFSYGRKPGLEIYRNMEIELPMTTDDKPDWDRMSAYMLEIEKAHITQVAEYIGKLGYPSHSETLISAEDQTVLDDLDNVRTDKFKLGDLFDVLTTKKRFDANKVTLLKTGGHPYVVRTSLNNGQRGRIEAESKYLNDGNTISLGQDTATIFYQPEPYFTGDKIKVLKPKFEGLNRHAARYMMTVMRKAFQGFSWGSTSFNVSILKDVDVELPVTEDGTPDVAFMNKYIKVIEKLTMQKVRQELDDRLEGYEKVTLSLES